MKVKNLFEFYGKFLITRLLYQFFSIYIFLSDLVIILPLDSLSTPETLLNEAWGTGIPRHFHFFIHNRRSIYDVNVCLPIICNFQTS